MTYYTVRLVVGGPLAEAAAVEWTREAAPIDSARGWEPCLRQTDGSWRFWSHDPGAERHRLAPGRVGDIAIRYRVAAAGPWSAASAARKEIVIVAESETEERDDPTLLAAPFALAAPALLGTGVIGTELSADPGRWGGTPAPAVAFQWRREGTAIPGATARAYAPGAADDRCAIDCLVSARNAVGSAEAAAGPVAVRHVAPTRRADLPEEIFDQSEEPARVETASAFSGQALTFSAAGFAIDPASGVLTLPLDRPVSGAEAVVVAMNSGGSARAVLRYAVEAAPVVPPRTLGAADARVLRSEWTPAGQAATFSPALALPGLAGETAPLIEYCTDADPAAASAVWNPVTARAGAAGVYGLAAASSTARPDPRLFAAAETARRGRLRLRWRPDATSPWSAASPALAVPLPAALPAPTEAMMAMSVGRSMLRYDREEGGSVSGNTLGGMQTRTYDGHNVFVIALAALAGSTARYGGKTPATLLLEQLAYWTAGGNAPAAMGGYSMQYAVNFACTVAVAKLVDPVWSALTDLQRTRLDLVMKGLLVSAAWQNADANPFVASNGLERSIAGESYGRAWSPNLTMGSATMPLVVAAYMGGSAAAEAFLNGFNRAAFAAQVAAAGGLSDLQATFSQDWTTTRAGPTAVQLQGAIRNYRYFGFTLAQTEEVLVRELNTMWFHPIAPGAVNPAAPGGYGIFEPLTANNVPRPNRGRNAWVGALADQAAWADLPNRGLIGMAKELDSADGGMSAAGFGSSGGGPRSAMSYAHHGSRCILLPTLTLAAYGQLDRSSARLQDAFARQSRGVTDLQYRTARGHRSFAKGGRLWGSANNEDWNETQAAEWRSASLWGLWSEVGAPWAAQG